MDERTFNANVIKWGTDRGILPNGSSVGAQLGKTLEEIGELWQSIDALDGDGILDAFGDIDVTLVLACALCLDDTRDGTSSAPTFGTLMMSICHGRELLDAYYLRTARKCLELLSSRHGVEMNKARAYAWDQIKDRKGRMVDGVFIKEAT